MEDEEKQQKGVKIGDFCLYRGVSDEGEGLFQYDGSVLYYVPDETYPIRITEIDGFYSKDRVVDIKYLDFRDYIMHKASILLYITFIPFNNSLRKRIRGALNLPEQEGIWA